MSDNLVSSIPFYIIGPDGSEIRHLKLGQDIPESQYLNLRTIRPARRLPLRARA